MYNLNELFGRVRKMRRRFIIRLCGMALIAVAAAVLIALRINETVTFLSIVTELALLLLLYRLFGKYKPLILFSRGIRGVNIKEDEYVGVRKINYHGRYNPRGVHIRLPRIRANRGTVNNGGIRSTVYLRLDDGNVSSVCDLYKSNTDLYEIGDTLVRYTGTKYPVIESRAAERQPCPMCGEVNSVNDTSCRGCGLGIAGYSPFDQKAD